MESFKLALQGMSAAQLRKLGLHYKKRVADAETKKELVDILVSTMSKNDQLDAMKRFVLASKGAVALLQFVDGPPSFQIEANFKTAGSLPQMVTIGKEGEIVDGMVLIQWALLVGKASYLDKKLVLQVEQEADVINSFYEPQSGILQVRAGAEITKKIGREWADAAQVDPATGLKSLGIRDINEFHEFADFVHGQVVRCKGEKKESRGFGEVSGKLNPILDDLRGTDDYTEFVDQTTPSDCDLAYRYQGVTVKVGFGFKSRTTVFRTMVNEEIVQDAYEKIKEFLNAGKGKGKRGKRSA